MIIIKPGYFKFNVDVAWNLKHKMSKLCRDDFDSGPKHVFSIEDGLWLGE